MSQGSTVLTGSLLVASALALGVAAHLAFADASPPPSPSGAIPEAPSETSTELPTGPGSPTGDTVNDADATPRHGALPSSPYDLAEEMVDAQRRAKIWDEEACLSAVRVVMREGARHALEITYGQADGRARPQAFLTARRITYTYGTSYLDSTAETRVGGPGRCLPEPNCPWQAASVAARDAGVRARDDAGGVYLYSSKYDRAVWTISAPGHNVSHVDGDSCTLLQR